MKILVTAPYTSGFMTGVQAVDRNGGGRKGKGDDGLRY